MADWAFQRRGLAAIVFGGSFLCNGTNVPRHILFYKKVLSSGIGGESCELLKQKYHVRQQ